MLLAVGAAYVFVLAWFNRQPIPTTRLVHETDSSLQLRETDAAFLGSKNRNAHWLEPGRYLASTESVEQPPGVADVDYGLLHIRLHTEYKTVRKDEPLGGLLKVYRKNLQFVKDSQQAHEGQWELLFVDRLPGPVKLTHLDRTRLRNEDGTYAPRKLAVLYYTPKNESTVYRTRIYDLEQLSRASFFDSAMREVGESWWERGRRTTNPQDVIEVVKTAAAHHLCPDDGVKFADSVYASGKFTYCVGRSGLVMDHVDFALPGTLEVVEFSLRGNTLLYSRVDDVVRFRILELPATAGGALVADETQVTQTLGPALSEFLRDVGSQSYLVQLHSTRPGHSIDVFLARGSTTSDTFYFSFSLFQNSTLPQKWTHKLMKRYRLPVHQQFSGLSRDELRLVNDAPLCEQVGLTTALYFKATDIAVAVDTEWFRDRGSSNVTQLQRIRESRLPYVSTLNSPVAVNMTLDESGALLAMSTVDDELFIFTRAQASSLKRILDYRRYFRDGRILPWVATEPKSSIDALEEGETDIFNWQLKLTWQPSTMMAGVHWDDNFLSPDNPFPAAQRFPMTSQQESTTTCLRFLHFDPTQISRDPGSKADAVSGTARAAATAATGDPAPTDIIRLLALSTSGTLRMWELNSHEQSPHVLWPFVTEHWGLMFMLAAVVSCCIYNERRWT
ncbi:hypothetical protein GQ54DRAFT_299206 [Martensiomyces pterosporus]|nr:hypothetical protein GQ54DRAFT_299206 [Martensiomyces pterosporus]